MDGDVAATIYQGMKLLGAAFLTGALSVTLGHRG
jgi:hypothetical protein